VEEIDWSVGQIIQHLKSLDLTENTLVIFTSDNGPWLVMDDAGGSAGILREGKQYTFEGGMRVPAIAYWPNTIDPGTEPAGLATMMDWLPTFASMADVPLPSDRAIDGKDISGLLTGTGSRADQELFYYMNGELRAYRSGQWKLKLPFKGQPRFLSWIENGFVAPHEMLLFNLAADPGEENNLAAENPQVVSSMLAGIEAFKVSLGRIPEAKKTGKNMDYGPYIRLLSTLVGKLLLCLIAIVGLIYLTVRLVRKRKPKSRGQH
jgi:arylsulfatase A-like enzyme